MNSLPQRKKFEMMWRQALAICAYTPYVLGGQGSKGNDCSGLVVDVLALCEWPIADRTASQLYEDLFTLKTPPSKGPVIACLFQKGEKGAIVHCSPVVLWTAGFFDPVVVMDQTSSRGYADYDVYDIGGDSSWEGRFLDVLKLMDEARPGGQA